MHIFRKVGGGQRVDTEEKGKHWAKGKRRKEARKGVSEKRAREKEGELMEKNRLEKERDEEQKKKELEKEKQDESNLHTVLRLCGGGNEESNRKIKEYIREKENVLKEIEDSGTCSEDEFESLRQQRMQKLRKSIAQK